MKENYKTTQAHRDKENARYQEIKGHISKRNKEYRKTHIKTKEEREYDNFYIKRAKSTLKGRISQWRWNAKDRGIEWFLDLEFIESLPLICHYTGEELTVEQNKPNTVSLDRIDNSKGYTKDNVVFCNWRVNQAKNTMSKLDFFTMCKKIVEFNQL